MLIWAILFFLILKFHNLLKWETYLTSLHLFIFLQNNSNRKTTIRAFCFDQTDITPYPLAEEYLLFVTPKYLFNWSIHYGIQLNTD